MPVVGKILQTSIETSLSRVGLRFGSPSDLRGLQVAFEKFVSIFPKKSAEEGAIRMVMAEDILQKLKLCTDQNVKNSAAEMIRNARYDINITDTMKKAELLLDSVNVAEGKYCPLFSPNNSFGNRSGNKASSTILHQELNSATKDNIEEITSRLGYSKPRTAYHTLRTTGNLDEVTYAAYARSSKFSSMMEYIASYPKDKAMTEYLYNEHYLPKYFGYKKVGAARSSDASDVEKLMLEIKKDYGTHVFLTRYDASDKEFLNKLKDEYQIWKESGGEKVNYTPALVVDRYTAADFLTDKAGGLHFQFPRYIAVPNAQTSASTLRHEMIHFVDKDIAVHRIQSSEISPLKRQQMFDAGASHLLIDHAAKNTAEEIAVIGGNCQMSKLPQSVKDDAIKKGLERYITEMPTHEEYFEKLLKNKFSDPEKRKVIEQLKQIYFKDGIPTHVSKAILEEPELLNGAKILIAKEGNHLSISSEKSFIADCRKELRSLM